MQVIERLLHKETRKLEKQCESIQHRRDALQRAASALNGHSQKARVQRLHMAAEPQPFVDTEKGRPLSAAHKRAIRLGLRRAKRNNSAERAAQPNVEAGRG